MDLHKLRDEVRGTLERRGLTQEAFARKHDLSSSWLNKFLRSQVDDPRYSSLVRLQNAVTAERRA